MITKITTQYFKQFETQGFPLEPLTLLAGPNNSGKSTLLQAAMVWNLGMQKWWEKKAPEADRRPRIVPARPSPGRNLRLYRCHPWISFGRIPIPPSVKMKARRVRPGLW